MDRALEFVVDRTFEWFQLQVRSGTLHTRQVIQELYGAKGESNLCPHCKKEPESIHHCLVRCKKAIAVRHELVITTAKELRELGVSPKSKVKVRFDNIELTFNKIKKVAGRKTSREYLCGMMGIENGVVKEVENGLVVAGIKRATAEKKVRTVVGKVKRKCLMVLHKLFKASRRGKSVKRPTFEKLDATENWVTQDRKHIRVELRLSK